MARVGPKVVAALALAAGLVGLTPAADDKPPDWSAFATAGEVSGEVVKVTPDGFTLKVAWLTAPPARPSFRGGYRRHGTSAPKVHYEQYTFAFADAGLVRWSKLPPKLDAKGMKIPYTDKELADLKKPLGATGYAADRDALKEGQYVDVILVRPKTVPADKAQVSDLRVKYAVIVAENPDKEKKSSGEKGDKKKDK